MRRLYAFLLFFVGVCALSSEIATAQTYAQTDYIVRKVDTKDAQGFGSGANWQSLQAGTSITPYPGYYQGVMGQYCTTGQQMPFNFRFLNNQMTTSNTFSVTETGDVIISPGWQATQQYYPYSGYYNTFGYMYGINNGSNYWYHYNLGDGNNEQDYGSYGYYANY